MRIVAKQKDYYDCIQAAGQDRSLVYVRDYKEEHLTAGWPFPSFGGFSSCDHFSYHLFIIGFCGNIYPVIQLYPRTQRNYNYETEKPESDFCFTIEHVDAFMQKHLKPKVLDVYIGKKDQETMGVFLKTEREIPHSLRRRAFILFFDQCKAAKGIHLAKFEEKRAPVFVAHPNEYRADSRIEWNALLSKYEFARLFPPYQAFQEISMFLGNLAVPQKPMPVISDEAKIQAHGFDKYSFRKEKGGK